MKFIVQIFPFRLPFVYILSLLLVQTLHASEPSACDQFNPVLEQAKCYCKKLNNTKNQIIANYPASEKPAWNLTTEANQTPDDYKNSLAHLCATLQQYPPTDSYHQAILLGSLGHAYFMVEEIEKAAIFLEHSKKPAQPFPEIAAVTLNNLGNVCSTYYHQDKERQSEIKKNNPHFKISCFSNSHQADESNQALTYYLESSRLADQVGNEILAFQAKLNWVQTALEEPSIDYHTIKKRLLNLLEQTHQLPPAVLKLQISLRLGQLLRLTYHRFPVDKPLLQYHAYKVLTMALNLATQLNHQPSRSQATGFIGQLYQDEQRYPEAQQWTHQAIFYAQNDQENLVPELLYYWQWQAGDLFKENNQPVQALLAYKQAIDTLWSIRYDFSKIYRIFQSSFRHQVGDLFLDFIELLLEYHATLSNEHQQEICRISNRPPNGDKLDRCLQKVQDTLEKLKAAELLDYFRNDCVINNQKQLTQTVKIGEETAVLYPILLENKLELLLYREHGKGETIQREIIHETVKATAIREKIRYEIKQLRDKFAPDRYEYDVFNNLKTLYDWLIRPLQEKKHLDNIATLVFVPDEKLRLLPIAALYDGEKYLVEQYAIAVVPGLTLTWNDNSEKSNDSKMQPMLFAGISTSESELETQNEIEGIADKICPNNNNCFDKLLDNNFTEDNLRIQLERHAYSVVHISSHAFFGGNTKETYLETYRKKPLYLEPFGELLLLNLTHEVPLNLVTLSACETALGDERAALGLGRAALRTGAQGVVATLWKVESFFTKEFTPIFYEQLKQGKTKAQALKNAQIKMITNPPYQEDRNYAHPFYWSAFILIGNWL